MRSPRMSPVVLMLIRTDSRNMAVQLNRLGGTRRSSEMASQKSCSP